MNDRNRVFRYVVLPALIMAACVLGPMAAQAQMTSTGIDCSQIAALHLFKQDNMRAGLTLMECGVVARPIETPPTGEQDSSEEPAPPNILVSNRTCTSGSTCTRSESFVYHSMKANDHTVVVNYNDHNVNQYSGTSYSTDDGATFTEISPPPFASGHGTNFGDPIVVYNQKLAKWFAGDLVTGCGGQGIGLWTSNDGISWTSGACAHSNSQDDRESMWVDNNPLSRTFGRMYISWNDFNVNGGALFVTHSDDGNNWTKVQVASSFIRDVQLTGTPPGVTAAARNTSTVFLAAMDEGGGGLATRQNIVYRSLDGGTTWLSATLGPRFNPVGDSTCPSNSYFARINPIWRHMGWGQPAAGPRGVVHYAYAGKGASENGDIYYVRSTDNGKTWSSPIVLNDHGTGFQTHWMPSVSVNYNALSATQPGQVTVSWYDRRQATSACNNVGDPGCNYQRYGIQSPDNGATWGSNFAISDIIIPQPAQNDSGVQTCYAGDYDYSTALNGNAFVTWTDGRAAVSGVQVQSVEYSSVPEP